MTTIRRGVTWVRLLGPVFRLRTWQAYRQLYREERAAAQQARDDVWQLGLLVADLLECAEWDNHPNPTIRGQVRQIRTAVKRLGAHS